MTSGWNGLNSTFVLPIGHQPRLFAVSVQDSSPEFERLLRSGWPVLDLELRHREVLDVAGGQAGSDADGGGGHQAVSLGQGDAAAGVGTPPGARPFALGPAEGCD